MNAKLGCSSPNFSYSYFVQCLFFSFNFISSISTLSYMSIIYSFIWSSNFHISLAYKAVVT